MKHTVDAITNKLHAFLDDYLEGSTTATPSKSRIREVIVQAIESEPASERNPNESKERVFNGLI